jgi:hypothetical protein
VPQAQATWQLLKHASAPPRSDVQRLELAGGTSPRELICHCSQEKGKVKFTLLRCLSAELFVSCCGSVAALPA